MNEVKRYDYGYVDDGNGARYLGLIEKTEGKLVRHDDYAALEAERERLRGQVATLQSGANSWQSGYDKGREDGAKAAEGWKAQHARDSAELRRLCSERDTLRAELAALKAPAVAEDEQEAPVVVATAILGGLFHGGSGPELGEIDIDVCTPALETIQCETVNSSDDVFLPLMTIAQHERIVAALTRPAQQPVGEASVMPGTSGFTVAVFPSNKIPLGTKIYATPIAQTTADGLVEALRELLYARTDKSEALAIAALAAHRAGGAS